MNPKIRLQAWSSIPVPSAMTEVQWVFFARPYAPMSWLSASQKNAVHTTIVSVASFLKLQRILRPVSFGSLATSRAMEFLVFETWSPPSFDEPEVPEPVRAFVAMGEGKLSSTACHLSNPSLRRSEKNSRKKSAHINSDLQFYRYKRIFFRMECFDHRAGRLDARRRSFSWRRCFHFSLFQFCFGRECHALQLLF